MFQLYKQRDFSTFVSDTFTFFKLFWRNFFGNYIVIMGGFIAALCVCYFFVFRDLFSSLFNTSNSGMGYDLSYYFTDSPVLFFVMLAVVIIISILFSIFSIAYPAVYLKMMEESGRGGFTSSEIFARIKALLPRIIRFSFLSMVVFIPLFLVAFVFATALILLVVGVFILILLIPAASVWMVQSFLVYVFNEDISFFDSMKQGWRILFSKKFWHIIGSAAVVYLIISIVQSLLSTVPYFIILFTSLAMGKGDLDPQLAVVFSVLYIISIAISYLFSNAVMVNQGLVYYSALEGEKHVQALSEIDLIGRNVE